MKKISKFALLLLVLFFVIDALSQSSQIDSLKLQYKIEKGQTSVKTLNRLCFKYAFNDKDSALHYLQKSLKIAKENGYDSLYTEALNIKGIVFDIQGETDSSEFYFLKTYNLSVEKGFKTYESFSTNNLGMMYWRRADHNKALDFFFKALKFNEENGVTQSVGSNYNNIGLIYQEMKLYSKAIEYHKKALDIRLNITTESDELADSYNNLAICFKSFNQKDSAKYYYEKSLESAILNENKQAEAIAYSGLSILSFENQEYEQALNYLLKARENSSFDLRSEMIDNLNFSGIYFSLKQYQKGLAFGKMAKDSLEHYGSIMVGNDVNKFLALNYAATNQPTKALEMISFYDDNIDSAFSKDAADALTELEVKYDTEKKEKALLEEKNKTALQEQEILASELKLSNRNKWMFSLAGASLGILFLGLFLIQRNKQKAQAEKDQALIKERDKGLKSIIDAQENERKRISKDLHDGIGQQLSGLKMAWAAIAKDTKLTNPEIAEKIEKLGRVLNSSAEEVRNISHQMMPKSLQELGLVPAISDMLEKSFVYSDMEYSFENFDAEVRFDDSIEISLYRITQELINNVIKHSKASYVAIQLIRNKNFLVLVIEDNGIGFTNKKTAKGHGLLNIDARLHSINGKVSIEGSPEGGTLATIRIVTN